jgi:hypothetical protein
MPISPISRQEIRDRAFSQRNGNAFALVHRVSAVCSGSGRDGLQQNDGLLVDEAQEPGSNNLYCGWMPWRSRLFDKPIALVEQSVVAANYA